MSISLVLCASIILSFTVTLAQVSHHTFVPFQNYSLEYTRNVWTFWDGTPTAFIQDFLKRSAQTLGSDWTLRILTPRNLPQYLDLSDVPYLSKFNVQLRSDYIRLRLLEKYGGWWIDASTLIVSKQQIESWISEATNTQAHLIAFCHFECPRKYLHTGVLYAPKGSVVVKAWVQQMQRMFSLGVKNYMYTVNREGVPFPVRIYTKYPSVKRYLVAYVAIRVALERTTPRGIPLITPSATQYLWKMINDCNNSKLCLQRTLSTPSRLQKYPITKFTSAQRRLLDRQFHSPPFYTFDTHPLKVGTALSTKTNEMVVSVLVLYQFIILLLLLTVWMHRSFQAPWSSLLLKPKYFTRDKGYLFLNIPP